MNDARFVEPISKEQLDAGVKVINDMVRTVRIEHSKLTKSQIKGIFGLFTGKPNEYYRECRKINKTIITLRVNHDIDTDKWARAMLEHYREVARVMEGFYRLYLSVRDIDYLVEVADFVNAKTTRRKSK